MKEIKGMGDRLFGLEKLMKDVKDVVGVQGKLAESFQRVQQFRTKNHQFKKITFSCCRIRTEPASSRRRQCCPTCATPTNSS
jgi:hypothetical protein